MAKKVQYYDSIKLVPLLSNEAKEATTALLWKPPLDRIKD